MIAAPGAMPVFTVVNYGDTRVGKTQWAATWPRCLIIGDAMERGYETVRKMDRSLWFEPDREPILKAVDAMADMTTILGTLSAPGWVDPLIASGDVLTLVFDAFSFYCDFYLANIVAGQAAPDTRQAYGALGMHLRDLRVKAHNKGVNVLWLCLAKHPEKDDKGHTEPGGPLIPGQQADKFAAGVDFLLYSRLNAVRKEGKHVGDDFEIRTRKYNGLYSAGNRLGADTTILPDPFTGTYAAFIRCLGHDSDAVRTAIRSGKPGPKPLVTAGNTTAPVARPPSRSLIPVKPATK